MLSAKTLTALWVVCLCILCGCTKYDRPGSMPKPGIALTFDDLYIKDWHKMLPFFDSFKVKATFYISNYNRINKEEKDLLHDIQNHGHEIAFHSVNHPDFVKYLKKNGMGKLEDEEINRGMEMMNKDGFYPTDFAFPYGSHNEVLTSCLLRKFHSVRYLNGTKNYSSSFTTTGGNSELYAMGMDLSSGKSEKQLLDFVTSAEENNNCLILVGHHIENHNTQMEVPFSRLRAIILAAKKLNMTFYTIAEISR